MKIVSHYDTLLTIVVYTLLMSLDNLTRVNVTMAIEGSVSIFL